MDALAKKVAQRFLAQEGDPLAVRVAKRFIAQQECEHEGEVLAEAPPGWEGPIKEMKKDKDIDNPWALAWYMKNKGDKVHKKDE